MPMLECGEVRGVLLGVCVFTDIPFIGTFGRACSIPGGDSVMSIKQYKITIISLAVIAVAVVIFTPRTQAKGSALDDQLYALLNQQGFTGRIGSTLEQRLGRKVDNQLADLGRLLFHDTIVGL